MASKDSFLGSQCRPAQAQQSRSRLELGTLAGGYNRAIPEKGN